MKKTLVPALVLALSAPAARAQAPTPAAGQPLTVTTGGAAPPPGSKQAKIEDLRVVTEQPTDPYEYERLGITAFRAGYMPRARTFFEKAWGLGQLPTAAYNLACVDVREGKLPDAMNRLKEAVAAGFDDEGTLQNDIDLAQLRIKPEFPGLVEGAKANRVKGDAGVITDGIFVAAKTPPAGILVVLHDTSSDPIKASGPYVSEAKSRGLFLAVPRGPSRLGKIGFSWAQPNRALAAVDQAVEEAKKRAGGKVPIYMVGIGRGGTIALAVAASKGGFAGVSSISGPFDPGAVKPGSGVTGLRNTKVFLGIVSGAPANLKTQFSQGQSQLKSQGIPSAFAEWEGVGAPWPKDLTKAVKTSLDVIGAPKG